MTTLEKLKETIESHLSTIEYNSVYNEGRIDAFNSVLDLIESLDEMTISQNSTTRFLPSKL